MAFPAPTRPPELLPAPTPPRQARPKRRKLLRGLLGVAGLAATLALGRTALGLWGLATIGARIDFLERVLAEERAVQGRVELPVFEAVGAVGEDCARRPPAFVPALAKPASGALLQKRRAPIGAPLPEETREPLAESRAALEALGERLRCDHTTASVVSPRTISDLAEPDYAFDAMALLEAEARDLAARGDGAAAARALLSLGRLGAELGRGSPFQITWAVMASSTAHERLGELVASSIEGVDRDAVASGAARLGPVAPSYAAILAGAQRSFELLVLREISGLGALGALLPPPPEIHAPTLASSGQSRVAWALPTHAVVALSLDESDALGRARQEALVARDAAAIEAVNARIAERMQAPFCGALRHIFHHATGYLRADLDHEAWRALLAGALTVERARSPEGAYPEQIELAVDPWSPGGERLRYEPRPPGYALWSLGKNRRDDQARRALPDPLDPDKGGPDDLALVRLEPRRDEPGEAR